MNFKAQVECDIKSVFHNMREFGEEKEIRYNGNFLSIPVIWDTEGAKDRIRPSADNVDGIFAVDVVMYAAHSDLEVLPRQGQNIEVDGDLYEIVSIGNEMGEVVLGLQRLDE